MLKKWIKTSSANFFDETNVRYIKTKIKMRKVQILILTLFVINGLKAQEDAAKIRVTEFHFQNGIVFNSVQHFGLADYKILAPNSELLVNDFSDFQANDFFIFNGPSSSSYQSIQLGLTFKSNPNPLWRIGISHISLGDISKGLSKSTIVPYDTLTSSQTGQQYFLDSTYAENYNMNYSSQQLRLETSLIYRTNPENRWSVYAGIGLSFGLSYNASTTINYNSFSYSSSYDQSYNYSNLGQDKREYFENKSNWSTSVFVPMGIDFRLGKKREFWKRLHLYHEMKPSITYTTIPDVKRLTNVNMINSLGLKVSF